MGFYNICRGRVLRIAVGITMLVLFIAGRAIALAVDDSGVDSARMQDALQMPGRLEANGTHFELNNCEYLNITLDSSEPIKLILESAPEMVTMHFESASDAASAQITLSGFAPQTTYHKYEDDYHNHTAFTTDARGSYTYIQDLSGMHLVFIQPRSGTKFIHDDATGGDCTSIGIWAASSKTCTLTTDLTETIQIDSNGITLDGSGHIITGSGTGSGVYLRERSDVIVKNMNIRMFYDGIFLSSSSNNNITGNTANSNNHAGIELFYYSNYNTLSDNIANSNGYQGIVLRYSNHNNTLSGNTANLNDAYNIVLFDSNNNTLNGNTANSSRLYGIDLSNSSSNTLSSNTASNNSDGITLYDSSNNNKLSGNTANLNRQYGVYMYSASNNRIYHNNFINNTKQAYDDPGTNSWDNGYPIGGNFWSDYNGTDVNNDSIGDIPYNISGGAGAQDRYPFMRQNGWLSAGALRGDINRNGRLDTGDATLILRSIVGLSIPSQYQPILPIGDMNCNGRIDTGDATLVLREVVGLPIPRCWE